MTANLYDDPAFFTQYQKMLRSQKGLAGAGEWQTLQALLPDFHGKTVLDLGCGYGWHCKYAAEHGAKKVIGVDISQKMLTTARAKNSAPAITYLQHDLMTVAFPPKSFEIVLSSLVFHYLPSFDAVAKKVHTFLQPNGRFIFSVEHPIFTASGTQDWEYDAHGTIKHFPVDRYFDEGVRKPRFLGIQTKKYHRTLTTYLEGLLANGFRLDHVVEPRPPEEMRDLPGMKDELRRPMMLIIAATKIAR